MTTTTCPHTSVCNGGYGRLRCTRCDAIVDGGILLKGDLINMIRVLNPEARVCGRCGMTEEDATAVCTLNAPAHDWSY